MKPIYLEPNEEITSVIERIQNEGDGHIALVVPKNSTLFQSLVNVKLLARESKKLQKEVALISTNKIGMRLAKQVGVPAYASLGALPNSQGKIEAAPTTSTSVESESDTTIDGVPVRQYNPNRSQVAPEAAPVESMPDSTAEEVSEEQQPPALFPTDSVETAESLDDTKESEQLAAPVESEADRNDQLPPIVARTTVVAPGEPFRMPWKPLLIALCLLLLLGVAAFFLLPKATVTITLPAETVSQKVAVSIRTQPTDSAVTGSLIKSQQSTTKTITATGKKDIGSKATGTVAITNKYRDQSGAGKDQSFPIGTKVTDTATKKVFTLTAPVTVSRVTYNPNNGQPIYDSKSVKVSAVEPGESYNISKSTFTIEGGLENTIVESSAGFTGGLTKQITVFSSKDLESAVTEAKTEMTEKASAELREKAKGLEIVNEAIWQTITKQTTDKKVDEEASTVALGLDIEYATIAFERAMVEKPLEDALSKDITEAQQLVFPEGSAPTLTFTSLSEDKSALNLDVAGEGYVVAKIDKVAVAASVKNKSVSAATDLLTKEYQATAVSVSTTPSWWVKRLPFLAGAIRIEYGFDTTKEAE